MRKRAVALFALALLALAVLVTSPARAADPYVHWYTVRSPHFRVNYHAGLDHVAQKVANVAEDVYTRLVPALAWAPPEVTEIVLTDEANDSNGFASTLPYGHITLFVTAPSDMSGLGDYDDWLTSLITHEFTHIVHTGNVSGAPDVVNSVLGPTLHPNQLQPNWIIEGLAVSMETAYTSGGRLRSSQFDMLIRADVLAGNFARLDEISNIPRRWPGANLWYLYGAHFVDWISSIYGPDTYAAVAADYGASLIPFGVNRAIRRATGKTYEELYVGYRADLGRQVAAESAEIDRVGRREGRRITFAGYDALGPRFLPPACGARSLAYQRGGGDDPVGVYTLPMDGKPVGNRAELVAFASGRTVAFMPDCSLVFDHIAPSRRSYAFTDIFRQPTGTRSPRGVEKNRQRLTTGRRAREPDVSADGRHIAYITDREGTATLRIADLSPDGVIQDERRLVPSADFEQAFTPRFSPDGTKVAYGVWTDGGYRDIRVVDVTGEDLVELFHDRALDQQPAWSPDGKTLYFTSDRTGFPNVFAYELESGALSQVTNVLTGAYMPEPSPNGRSLVYVGYTTDGFDLFEIPLERSRFLSVKRYVNDRPERRGRPFFQKYPVEPFNPWPSLRPRSWYVSVGTSTFGTAFTFTTSGFDAINRHGFSALVSIATERPEPVGQFDYFYNRLPFGFQAQIFHSFVLGSAFRPGEPPVDLYERQTGATTGVAFGIPGDGEAQSISLSYTLAFIHHPDPFANEFDPYAPLPAEPDEGIFGGVRLGYTFSNASATPRAISLERGFRVAAFGDFADRAWGSEWSLTAFSGEAAAYVPMPWLSHHVFALGLSGGSAVGTYVARRGLYQTGGFTEQAPLDSITSGIRQGSFVLRGYDPGQFQGTNFNLLNLEYRFPIADVDRGLSTLPVFLRNLHGAFFFDWGGAYNELDLKNPWDSFQVGVGAELWIHLILGYDGFLDTRLGFARGLDSTAPEGVQTYFVVSSQF